MDSAVEPVADMYSTILGRHFDQSGYDAWTDYMYNHNINDMFHSWMSITPDFTYCEAGAIAYASCTSSELTSLIGDRTTTSSRREYVTRVFKYLIGRTPDSSSIDYFANFYNTYPQSYTAWDYMREKNYPYYEAEAQICYAIGSSPEATSYMANKYGYSGGRFTYTRSNVTYTFMDY